MNDDFFRIWVFLTESPLLWLTLTLCVYLFTLTIYKRANSNSFLLPVLTSVVILVPILQWTDTPYEHYFEGAQFIQLLIGPATVALAIPLYKQLKLLRQHWKPIMAALFVGTNVAMFSTVFIAWALGGSSAIIIAMMPKSATMPIAMALVDYFGSEPSLAAVSVAITGIGGTIIAVPLLRMMKVTDPITEGFTLGLTAHAIGTARSMQLNQTTGAFSALGMSLTGIATALLMPAAVAIGRSLGML
jgi:predicted murein hydrolase (TIGR00659 family)